MTGKNPLFAEPLHVGRPNIGDRAQLLSRFKDLLDRQWLTNDGPYVRAFEDAVAEYLGVRHCLAVCNATIGLQLAIRALDLQGEVIVPSFTFPATVHAIEWEGLTPVFCDIDPATLRFAPPAQRREVDRPDYIERGRLPAVDPGPRRAPGHPDHPITAQACRRNWSLRSTSVERRLPDTETRSSMG